MGDGWMEAVARAKVNLRLRIFPRGSDGYHPIETVFCRIDFADRMRLRRRPEAGVTIRVSGPESVPSGPDNLAARAAALFLERFGLPGGAEIELEKHVPPGSGLGGGSSDAALVLRLLAEGADSTPQPDELLRLAAQLGADVAFFVADTPLAVAGGRGDDLRVCPPLEPRPMVLLLPDVPVSTAEAYELWDADGLRGEEAPTARSQVLPPLTWEEIRSSAANDFEPVIFRRHPGFRALREKLDETDPFFALLTGSGSALFAVYESDAQRDGAMVRLKEVSEGVRLVSACGPV
jgi:4-diphosphocytidyl-2-C-methyl-D-erythritol kinase